MATLDVPADEWPQFLDDFSRRHRAWLTRIEPALSGLGQSLPLGAVTTERDGRRIAAIEVSFAADSGADAVRIENPVSVRVRQTSSGDDETLEIVDDEGFCTRLSFRTSAKPEMLDGLAPGERSN
jgi:hypothetical protein